MTIYPSIYDLTLDAVTAYDFSRPLFVQASPPRHFDEVLDVLHQRLRLPRKRSQLLTNPIYPYRPWDTATHVVRHEDRLSSRTADLNPTVAWADCSVVVVTTTIRFGDSYTAMRYQGNIACFCHAIEPIPCVLVNAEGQTTTPARLFEIVDRTVGGVTLTGNILISERETEALYAAALQRRPGHVVEVGRFSGGTAMVLAVAGRASGRPGVTSIDIERLPSAEHFFAVNGLSADIELRHGDSTAVAAQWGADTDNSEIGLLFIDADHSYDAVVRDLIAWTPHLAPGGSLVLHDVGTPDCGVARAVHYFVAHSPDYVNLRQIGTMFFCERAPVH
jgi:predicted O-methyltransferase YrrM